MQYYTMPTLRSVPRSRDSIFMIAVLPQVPRAVRPACRVLPCWGDHHAGYDDGGDDGDDDGDDDDYGAADGDGDYDDDDADDGVCWWLWCW